ncbi:hypothetical protein [Pilibacter termitis]|uniref:hypothetical protein n=1 Tax=Pilibacter termitis TaxID=263852 RepID=UPI0013565D97|nr:hypothetical protein [Pilibacter termitis]
MKRKFRATLRAVARLQPLTARHRKATRGVQGFVAVSHAIYLLLHFVSHTVFLKIKDS